MWVSVLKIKRRLNLHSKMVCGSLEQFCVNPAYFNITLTEIVALQAGRPFGLKYRYVFFSVG